MGDYVFRLFSVVLSLGLFLSTLICFKRNILDIKASSAKWYFIASALFFIVGFYSNTLYANGETLTSSDAFYKVGGFLGAWGIYLSLVTSKVKRATRIKVWRCIVMVFASFAYFGVPCGLPPVESYPNEITAEIYRDETLSVFYAGIFLQVLMMGIAMLIRKYESIGDKSSD